jgi:hypothetical protein
MRAIYCIYDKSLRGGSYFLHLPPEMVSTAQAAYDGLVSAAPAGFETLRWPDLHGGLLVIDKEWSCIYRFVEGKDASSRPRPLNVVLMALVRSVDIRGRDWRGILTGTAFRDLAARAAAANHSLPPSCSEEVLLPELTVPQSMVTELLDSALGGAGDEGRVCAAVVQAHSSGPVLLLITEQNGRRSFKVVRTGTRAPVIRHILETSRESDSSEASGTARLGTVAKPVAASGGSPSMEPYLKAARQYAVVAVPVLIVGMLAAWWLKPSAESPKVGQWYRVKELGEGGARYELIEIDAGEAGFRFDGDEGGKLILTSRYGEERRVPRGIVGPGMFRLRGRLGNPQVPKQDKLKARDGNDVGSGDADEPAQSLP